MTALVTSSKGLLAALAAARPGDAIRLAPGSYPAFRIPAKDYGGVTIASADRKKAILTGLWKLTGVSGLTFYDLEWAFPQATTEVGTTVYGVRVQNSKRLKFLRSWIHGTLDNDPSKDIGGLSFKGCDDIEVSWNELEQLKNGLNFGDSTKVKAARNNFHDIRADGIDVAASEDVDIHWNEFSSFRHLGSVGTNAKADHSDAIQFNTGGQTKASRDIRITNNLIVQGEGAVMQGIFIQDEAGVGPYVNVTISGNRVIGGNWNGIAAPANTVNLSVTGNTVACIGYVDPATITAKNPKGTVTVPWIKPASLRAGNSFPVVKDGGLALIAAHRAAQTH